MRKLIKRRYGLLAALLALAIAGGALAQGITSGTWMTIAGMDGLTPVALKVASDGTVAVGADPGGAVQGCSGNCIVVGGMNGLTQVPLKVGADGTLATSGGGGGGGYTSSCSGNTAGTPYVCSLTLSSAQLLALGATPVQLIAAPGAGKIIVPNATIFLQYKFGTMAYTVADPSNTLVVSPAGDASDDIIGVQATGFLDQTASEVVFEPGNLVNGPAAQTAFSNVAMDVELVGMTPGLTAGNGTLTVTMYYAVVALT